MICFRNISKSKETDPSISKPLKFAILATSFFLTMNTAELAFSKTRNESINSREYETIRQSSPQEVAKLTVNRIFKYYKNPTTKNLAAVSDGVSLLIKREALRDPSGDSALGRAGSMLNDYRIPDILDILIANKHQINKIVRNLVSECKKRDPNPNVLRNMKLAKASSFDVIEFKKSMDVLMPLNRLLTEQEISKINEMASRDFDISFLKLDMLFIVRERSLERYFVNSDGATEANAEKFVTYLKEEGVLDPEYLRKKQPKKLSSQKNKAHNTDQNSDEHTVSKNQKKVDQEPAEMSNLTLTAILAFLIYLAACSETKPVSEKKNEARVDQNPTPRPKAEQDASEGIKENPAIIRVSYPKIPTIGDLMKEKKDEKTMDELFDELEKFRELPKEEYWEKINEARKHPEFEKIVTEFRGKLERWTEMMRNAENKEQGERVATEKNIETERLIRQDVVLYEAIRRELEPELYRYLRLSMRKTTDDKIKI